jgi:hypothetical protein
MRAFEFLTEAAVGREFNHLEDLVFTDPQGGALKAVDVLKNLASGAKDVAVKWDGNPTVYWGRDEDGSFQLVGKNNWTKPEGKSRSPEELEKFILSRGKGEEWRPKFAKDMASLWPVFEKATPTDFRGYVYGDLLYHPGKPYAKQDGKISFTPNQSTYDVNPGSETGERISRSTVGVAVHSKYTHFGDKIGEPIKDISALAGNPELFVVGQTYVTHKPAVGAENINTIASEAKKSQSAIAKILEKQPGLSDVPDMVYRFINTMSRNKQLDRLDPKNFFEWLPNGKVSAPKQQKVIARNEENPGAFASMFFLIREIMKAKDEVIRELDSAEGDIKTHTNGVPGGEGYVKTGDKVKLVPRDRWTPFRSD